MNKTTQIRYGSPTCLSTRQIKMESGGRRSSKIDATGKLIITVKPSSKDVTLLRNDKGDLIYARKSNGAIVKLKD